MRTEDLCPTRAILFATLVKEIRTLDKTISQQPGVKKSKWPRAYNKVRIPEKTSQRLKPTRKYRTLFRRERSYLRNICESLPDYDSARKCLPQLRYVYYVCLPRLGWKLTHGSDRVVIDELEQELWLLIQLASNKLLQPDSDLNRLKCLGAKWRIHLPKAVFREKLISDYSSALADVCWFNRKKSEAFRHKHKLRYSDQLDYYVY